MTIQDTAAGGKHTMGRVVVAGFISIDGVIQAALWQGEDDDGGFAHGGWVPPLSGDLVNDFMRTTTMGPPACCSTAAATRSRGMPGRTSPSRPWRR